ncbi:MAG: hypothetical protein V4628_05190 [Pseudomonadota bacterium]
MAAVVYKIKYFARKAYREILALQVAAGSSITWSEFTGRFSSNFTVLGSSEEIQRTTDKLNAWISEDNAVQDLLGSQ